MQSFIRNYWRELLISAAGLLVIISFLAAPTYHGPSLDAENAAQYGDFIGGVIGTLLLVVSASLLVAAYRQQEKTEKIRSFEAHFFEMLKYHRDNMTEIDVDGIKGRRAFVSFIREWRLALETISLLKTTKNGPLDVGSQAQLAYLDFFHGSGPNASHEFFGMATKKGFEIAQVKELVASMSKVWINHPKNCFLNIPTYKLSAPPTTRYLVRKSCDRLAYAPFGGHHSRLAHYYRHLYQLIDYINDTGPPGLRERYAGLVRAQLSTHEQALLAIHVHSVSDRWTTKRTNFISKYGLIDDLPDGFLTADVFPQDVIREFKMRMHCDGESKN